MHCDDFDHKPALMRVRFSSRFLPFSSRFLPFSSVFFRFLPFSSRFLHDVTFSLKRFRWNIQAYKAADATHDGFIQRSEFMSLLKYLVYFNNIWHKFEEIDSDHDRRLSEEEFGHGCDMIGMPLSDEKLVAICV